jgi:hypothetical protein
MININANLYTINRRATKQCTEPETYNIRVYLLALGKGNFRRNLGCTNNDLGSSCLSTGLASSSCTGGKIA